MAAKFRAYAELGRISNLPTTISNVLTGAAAGAAGFALAGPVALDWWRIAAVAIAMIFFYVAGMAMNDVFDASIDMVERPNRPVPSGRISRHEAIAFTGAMSAIALVILAAISLPALANGVLLAILIVSYNYLHRAMAASVVLLGLIRAAIYSTASAATAWQGNWTALQWMAGALAAYTAAFSFIARSETQEKLDRRRWLAVFLPFIAAIPAIAIHPKNCWWMIVPLAIMLAWISRAVGMIFASPPQTRNAVMMWIAGISLLDALYLTLLDRPWLAAGAAACFVITVLMQRRIAGT